MNLWSFFTKEITNKTVQCITAYIEKRLSLLELEIKKFASNRFRLLKIQQSKLGQSSYL